MAAYPMSAKQMAEAMAYYRLEPWGPERDALHAAIVACAAAQPWTKKRLRPQTYMPEFRPPGLAASDEGITAEDVHRLATRMGARIVARSN